MIFHPKAIILTLFFLLQIICHPTECDYHAAEKGSHLLVVLRSISPNQSWWLCGANITSVSHNKNIDNNGWQTHYLYLSAPSLSWQKRCKLSNLSCPADFLKYVWNWPWYIFNSSMRRWISPSISLLCRRGVPNTSSSFTGKHDEDRISITGGWVNSFPSLVCLVKTFS